MTRERHSAVPPAAPPAQDIKLRASDGAQIAATFQPGRDDHDPAVLLLRGVGASRQAVALNAAWLARVGYATLAIDFHGHGDSDPAMRTFGLHEALDARAAFDWLRRHQHDARIAVIGISLGGAAGLIGDAGPLPTDAPMLQAVYPDIRHAIRNRIADRLGSRSERCPNHCSASNCGCASACGRHACSRDLRSRGCRLSPPDRDVLGGHAETRCRCPTLSTSLVPLSLVKPGFSGPWRRRGGPPLPPRSGAAARARAVDGGR